MSSFYCYLNHNPEKEFIIDLDNVWKWCGFSRKSDAKRILVKYFVEKVNYKITYPNLNFVAETSVAALEQGSGANKEQILMTIKTFKKFCLKARTDKADKIHDYYIKLEEFLHETLEEESESLRERLLNKENEIKDKENIIKFQEEELKNQVSIY